MEETTRSCFVRATPGFSFEEHFQDVQDMEQTKTNVCAAKFTDEGSDFILNMSGSDKEGKVKQSRGVVL